MRTFVIPYLLRSCIHIFISFHAWRPQRNEPSSATLAQMLCTYRAISARLAVTFFAADRLTCSTGLRHVVLGL